MLPYELCVKPPTPLNKEYPMTYRQKAKEYLKKNDCSVSSAYGEFLMGFVASLKESPQPHSCTTDCHTKKDCPICPHGKQVCGDSIETVTLNNVEVQANGIIRNSAGYLIGRLVDSVSFQGQHVRGFIPKEAPKREKIEPLKYNVEDIFGGPLHDREVVSKINEIIDRLNSQH